jgi:hypothetical protein
MGSFCRKCASLNDRPKDGLGKKLVQNCRALGKILIHVQTLDLKKVLTSCLPFTLRSATVRDSGYISEKVFSVASAVTCVNFGLEERPGGDRIVVSKPNF